MGCIIIDGNKHKVIGDVRLWTDTGLEIKPGHGARKRHRDVNLVVWHFTGGEGNAKQLMRVLHNRKLGVEFFIDREGVIWQFCDPIDVDTFDAGIANRRSVGVEIANYGYRQDASKIPMKGRDRRTYETNLHGRPLQMAHFYTCQTAAALSLAAALSKALLIPREVPKNTCGHLMLRCMGKQELKEFSGHVGHYHITDRKIDPGTSLLNVFSKLFALRDV